MSSLTCLTCRVVFASANVQRTHYHTDWHTYNLKRKVAGLNPVTAERFNEKVLSQRSQTEEAKTEGVHCSDCNKYFASLKAFENHQQSKKHRENTRRQKRQDSLSESEKKDEEKMEAEADEAVSDDDDGSVESWSGEALGLEQCLFCHVITETLESNLTHMKAKHSFFIPDAEYVTDLDGLMAYLCQKVGEGRVCLWCNRQSFADVKAVQRHMVDKGHCQMLFEGDSVFEYSDYYDYSSGYTDGGDPDEELLPEVIGTTGADMDSFQLALPSGQVIGHRSLHRYYRQSLRPDRPRATNASRILAQYRGLGPSTGAALTQRARDMSYLRRRREQSWMKLGVKGNKMQKYFRDQVFGIRF